MGAIKHGLIAAIIAALVIVVLGSDEPDSPFITLEMGAQDR